MHRLRDAEIPHRRHLTAQPLMLARRSAGGNPRRRISHNGTALAVRPGNGSSIESALRYRDSQRKIAPHRRANELPDAKLGNHYNEARG